MKILDSYFESCSVILLDIETTGLFPERDKVVIVGLLPLSGDADGILQFFAESAENEKDLLLRLVPHLEDCDVIVSFNGNSFDIPFLNRRLARNEIGYQIPLWKNFDLYRVIRQAGFTGILPDLKQTTVERYLGIEGSRQDSITGRESARLYREYEKNGDPRLKEVMLLHNHDDVLQLQKLMAILKNVDLHRAMFLNGFNIVSRNGKINIQSISVGRGDISVKGSYSGPFGDYVRFGGCYDARLSAKDGSVAISIPLRHEHGHCYIDLGDFDIDPGEFTKYPNCRSGYLIVSSSGENHHAEINHLIKRICREILESF